MAMNGTWWLAVQQLSPALQLYLLDHIEGGLTRLEVRYDADRGVLLWARFSSAAPDTEEPLTPKGEVSIPPPFIAELERL